MLFSYFSQISSHHSYTSHLLTRIRELLSKLVITNAAHICRLAWLLVSNNTISSYQSPVKMGFPWGNEQQKCSGSWNSYTICTTEKNSKKNISFQANDGANFSLCWVKSSPQLLSLYVQTNLYIAKSSS